MNQTAKITLRHLVSLHKTDWVDHLSEVEYWLNNLVNKTTNLSPMQFLIGIEPHTSMDWVSFFPEDGGYSLKQWLEERNRHRIEAIDSVVFIQACIAIYYDKKHTPITFKPGDKVFITITTGIQSSYHLSNNVLTKLSECRVGPFTVLNTVGRLAYKVDIPKSWNIHLVISIVHLERFRSNKYRYDIGPLPAELIEDDSGTHEEYEVRAIIAKQYNK